MIQNLSCSLEIAETVEKAKRWTQRSIVVDLFRFSTTVCALLESGHKQIRICANPKYAVAIKNVEKNLDLFSEIDLGPSVTKYDNSPYDALYSSDKSKPVLIVTSSGSPAVLSLEKSKEILIACFVNMPYVVEYILSNKMDTLIIPACIYYNRSHVEDFICSRTIVDAVNGRDTFGSSIAELHESSRVLEFMTFRPQTGRRDLELILRKGTMKVIPRVTIKGLFGHVENIYGLKE